MASKAFEPYLLRLLKGQEYLYSASLYGHLVTAEPARSAEFLSDVTLAAGGNYTYTTLSDMGGSSNNRVISDGDGGVRFVMNPAAWGSLYLGSATPITGIVISTGTNSSARVVSYVERLVSGVATPWTPPTVAPGNAFSLDLSTNGILHIINNGAV